MTFFRKFAQIAADLVGSPSSFLLGVLITLLWAMTGPYFHYSDTWQLVINTGTSIVTFLMVFLIQNTQNRDARVVHMKLDELIRAVGAARTELVQMERMSDRDLETLRKQFESERDLALKHLETLEQSWRMRKKSGTS